MHLYFGCQKRKEHFLYEKELVALEKSGTIDKLYVACSRGQVCTYSCAQPALAICQLCKTTPPPVHRPPHLQLPLDANFLVRCSPAMAPCMQTEKVYVQHLLRQNGKEVYAVLKGGGHFYVCGDAKHMARDVNSTLVQVAVKEGGLTEQQAVNWVKDLRLRKRYAEDVWS